MANGVGDDSSKNKTLTRIRGEWVPEPSSLQENMESRGSEWSRGRHFPSKESCPDKSCMTDLCDRISSCLVSHYSIVFFILYQHHHVIYIFLWFTPSPRLDHIYVNSYIEREHGLTGKWFLSERLSCTCDCLVYTSCVWFSLLIISSSEPKARAREPKSSFERTLFLTKY